MGTTRITAEPGLPFIDIEREFDAPRDLVFRAYVEPDLLTQWIGPDRLSMDVLRWEPRDGGAWRYVNREPDGTEYGFHGVFHGDPTPERITQTFEFDLAPGHVSLETITFEERDGRTISRVHSTYSSVEARDAMVQSGMQVGLDQGYAKLDTLLARLAGEAG